MKEKKVWIYIEDSRTLKEVLESSCVHSEHAPTGKVRFYPRKGSDKWSYVYFGETKEVCIEAANADSLEKIAELKEEIRVLEAKLVTGYFQGP